MCITRAPKKCINISSTVKSARVGDGRSGPTGGYVREGVPDRGVQGGGAPRPMPAQRKIFEHLRRLEVIF